MKDNDTKARFLELRAQGLSYNAISKELNTSKQTMIEWGKEFKEELENLRAVELEALHERFLLTKEKRLEAFGEMLVKIGAELKTRELAEAVTPQVLSERDILTAKTSRQAQEERDSITASIAIHNAKGFRR